MRTNLAQMTELIDVWKCAGLEECKVICVKVCWTSR